MIDATLTLHVEANASQSPGIRAHPHIPLFVPRGQLYYWSDVWQQGEREALRELAAGRFRSFPNGSAAAAWLLNDEA